MAQDTPLQNAAPKARYFPCRQCGADFEFSATDQGLKCPYCGHIEKVPRTKEDIEEFGLQEYLAADKKPRGYSSEGKDITVTEDRAQTRQEQAIQAEAVLPFRVTKDTAVESFKKWISGLWFAPSALKRMAYMQDIEGIYRPCWTFDSYTASHYNGERGDYYYETERYTVVENGKQVTKTRQVRKTRWSWRSGMHEEFFDDVIVHAGRPIEWDTQYDLRGLVPFDPKYLAGWQGERYSVMPEQGWAKAKQFIEQALFQTVRKLIGGDEQRNISVSTRHVGVKFKLILLPLFLSSYQYGRKIYRFQVNGQSGEVYGQRPYSFWKIFFLILGIVGGIAGLIALMSLAGK
jgi:hypothetical protein